MGDGTKKGRKPYRMPRTCRRGQRLGGGGGSRDWLVNNLGRSTDVGRWGWVVEMEAEVMGRWQCLQGEWYRVGGHVGEQHH